MDVQNKTIMITGAGTGLGYTYAEIVLRNGAKSVAIVDLPASNGQNATATLEEQFGKGRVVFMPCDVTNAKDLEATFKKVVDTFKGLDILINNAGMLNDNQWEQTIDLNVKALIRCSFLALEYMGKNKGGKGGVIVNIASIVGLFPLPILPVYSATKFAVVGFSKAVANLHHETGVRVVVMCPGVTKTRLVEEVQTKVIDVISDINMTELIDSLPKQTTDNVARAMLDLIQKGKNGAVWVSEGGQPPYAVDFPHYSKQSQPV